MLAILLSSLTDDFLAILPNRESLLTLFSLEFLAPLSSNSSALRITNPRPSFKGCNSCGGNYSFFIISGGILRCITVGRRYDEPL